MKITDHFTTEELGNVPAQYAANQRRLAELLEILRRLLGDRRFLKVSGYRTPTANEVAKGVGNSAHLVGAGADFTPEGLSSFDAAAILLAADKAGKMPRFGEIIFYPFTTGHIHVTLPGFGGNQEWLVKAVESGKYEIMTAEQLARFPRNSGVVITILLVLGAIYVVKRGAKG